MDDPTVREVYDSMNEEQKEFLHHEIGRVVTTAYPEPQHFQYFKIFKTMNRNQKKVFDFMVQEAKRSVSKRDVTQVGGLHVNNLGDLRKGNTRLTNDQ